MISINSCGYPLTERMTVYVDHYFDTIHTFNNAQDETQDHTGISWRILPVYQIIRALKEMTRYMQELIAEFEYEVNDKTSTTMFNDIMEYMQNIGMYNHILKILREKHADKSNNWFKNLDLYFTKVVARPMNQYTKEHFKEIYNNYNKPAQQCSERLIDRITPDHAPRVV
jgi:hypothetical protein